MNTELSRMLVMSAMLFPVCVQAQTLQLISQGSEGLAIDGGSGGRNIQNVELRDANEFDESQLWIEHSRGIDRRGNEYFAYEKLGTNFCLDGNGGGEDNQNVYLYECINEVRNQHWLKVDLGGGSFRLEKRNASEYSLAGVGGNLVLQNNSSSATQAWFFRTVSDGNNENPETPDNVPPPPIPGALDDALPSAEEAAAFLTQATFGPTESTIAELQRMGYSAWFKDQLSMPIVEMVDDTRQRGEGLESVSQFNEHSLEAFFKRVIEGEDQLRQRAAFALSEIFATGTKSSRISRKSVMHASYQDTMQRGAFGNFRDLLEDITYHPLMGFYLTYAGNQKADEQIGSVPDENYAREIMQLFTIGLSELNDDATPKLSNGQWIETYDNDDVVELSKIFTGLYYGGLDFGERHSSHNAEEDLLPMEMHNQYHSSGAKTFLGATVPDLGDGDAEISAALDILFAHDNVGPFICAQLIQRLTFSNPHGFDYTRRCTVAFNTGEYTLPDGSVVGTGKRGDLNAVWAAILLDADVARNPDRFEWADYGKAREPVIGFIHWARVADIDDTEVERTGFRKADINQNFGQTPYQSPSVFNFFRPGYVPTTSSIGALGKVAPELQIFNASTLINYANAMLSYNTRMFNPSLYGFIPKFNREVELADNAEALAEHLNLVMTAGRMDDDTVQGIVDTIESLDLSDDRDQRSIDLLERVVLAMQLTVTSSEFRTQH